MTNLRAAGVACWVFAQDIAAHGTDHAPDLHDIRDHPEKAAE
jgi:hypothetical protein